MTEQPHTGSMDDPDHEEREYLLRRADDHLRQALSPGDPETRAIHRQFERLYRDRADRAIMVHQD